MLYKPHGYQKYAENFIITHPEAGLFLDMGLGKTVTTLTAISKLMWDIGKVLVIAPKRPALDTWPEELGKWDHLKGLTYSVVMGTVKQREAALLHDADIYIINRENVVWIVNQFKRKPWPFDCVVIDELSSFKSSKAQRFRALKRVRPQIRRIIGLTGTPAGNGLMDLWAECYLLDGGKALGRTITGYRDQYFTPGRRNGMVIYDWNLRKGAHEQIMDRLKPLCISMKTEDYLSLPDRITIERTFTLSAKSMKQYKRLERDLLLCVDGETIDAVNAAALNTKLQQISSGAVYADDGSVKVLHDDRLDALDQILEEAQGENVLVFYAFKHELDRIKERHPEAVEIREPGAIADWKAGKIKLLLAHPASAGHGLNLQSGGHISVWFGLTTSLELYQQALKRLHRQGQTKTCKNFVLMAKGTYDERIYYDILTPKDSRQDTVLSALKAQIKEVQKCTTT
ncbi:MAG: DEAD/DEAH box helicase [Lentihominibacter sp.]|uniref:DEAD/DEAH box helicase n=1 Tax=Lentihominibacter sp. TaxID=2944216 RepID=UPI002A9148FA|nr:DEAD/DEAH box helicase [Lentihominibacter sp.]MDY5287616.1 DEAD/DEAH box helicase [Lentihominibacter sp.]